MSSNRNIIYPKVNLRDVLRALWRGMKPNKLWFFVVIFSMMFINIVDILIPLLYKKFFDIITTSSDKMAIAPSLLNVIILVAILNFIIWVTHRILSYANNIFQPATIAKLKQQSYDYLMEHSYDFFSNNFTGSLVQRVNRFARAFERLADRLSFDVIPLLVQIVSVIIVLIFIQPFIALSISVWAVLLISLNISFSVWKFKYDVRVAEIDSKTTGYLADTITNHNTIQLFSNLNSESLGYRGVTNEQANATRYVWNLSAIFEACQAFMIFLIEFLLFYFTIKYWKEGLVTVGVFVLLQVYILTLSRRIWDSTRVVRDAFQSYADAKEMVEILMLPHGIVNSPGAKKLEVRRGEIIFKDLTFSFNKTREVLSKLNLTIKPGEKVALVGPSGAGKTTFIRLLLRLYTPTAGQILIDGEDISHVTQESLRDNIALVPQDPILFHRSLSANIGYGKKEFGQDEVARAGQLAHCDEFINNLPAGYDTFVGERGIKLSGGERQRVAIARAILKNAPILVLDEATSSLDSHSESLIQDALNTLMKDRTSIVIAHRLSTIQKMDRIIVLENGAIVEEGNHETLLKNENSLYRKLWSLQAGGFIQDN